MTTGDSYIMFVERDAAGRVTSRAVHSFGSATLDHDSPHYADQTSLFAEERARSTPVHAAELEGQLARRYRPGEELESTRTSPRRPTRARIHSPPVRRDIRFAPLSSGLPVAYSDDAVCIPWRNQRRWYDLDGAPREPPSSSRELTREADDRRARAWEQLKAEGRTPSRSRPYCLSGDTLFFGSRKVPRGAGVKRWLRATRGGLERDDFGGRPLSPLSGHTGALLAIGAGCCLHRYPTDVTSEDYSGAPDQWVNTVIELVRADAPSVCALLRNTTYTRLSWCYAEAIDTVFLSIDKDNTVWLDAALLRALQPGATLTLPRRGPSPDMSKRACGTVRYVSHRTTNIELRGGEVVQLRDRGRLALDEAVELVGRYPEGCLERWYALERTDGSTITLGPPSRRGERRWRFDSSPEGLLPPPPARDLWT